MDIRTNCSRAQGKHPLREPRPPSSKLLPNTIKHRRGVRHLRLATKYLHIGPRPYEGIARHRRPTSLHPSPTSPQTGKLLWGLQPLLDIRTNWSCALEKCPQGVPRPPSSKLLPNTIKHRRGVRHLRLATKYLHIGPRPYEGIARHRQPTSRPTPKCSKPVPPSYTFLALFQSLFHIFYTTKWIKIKSIRNSEGVVSDLYSF